jgi:hypothetical protein
MHRTRHRSHRPLHSSLTAFALSTAAYVISPAPAVAGGQHWRLHDSLSISGAPAASVTAGQAYTFTPAASDSIGRALQFSILNMPAWATFSTSSGQLSGTPSAANVGSYGNITITVSDGLKQASLPAFSVQVLAGSTAPPPPAPTISGTPPPSDVAGSAYSFQPSASGPSGMTLSFSVQNKPSWANFSIASGLLSGTPATSQTGTYTNIVVSVSDGQASSALPAFSITVTAPTVSPPPSGTATVSLTPPTQNTDGSTLTDLAGMTLYYGTAPTSLNQSVQLAAAPTSYTIGNLSSGTWYFGAIAYTTDGTQSAMTPLMSKNVQWRRSPTDATPPRTPWVPAASTPSAATRRRH